MSFHEMVKTQKWYYLHNMRSVFSILIGNCIEINRDNEGEGKGEEVFPL